MTTLTLSKSRYLKKCFKATDGLIRQEVDWTFKFEDKKTISLFTKFCKFYQGFLLILIKNTCKWDANPADECVV